MNYFPDSPETWKSGFPDRFPEIQEIRISRTFEKSWFPEFHEFSGIPEIPISRNFSNIDILIFWIFDKSGFTVFFREIRISEKSGSPDFSDFWEIRNSGFPGIPRSTKYEHPKIQDFRKIWKSGFYGFPDYPDYSYSINCFRNYFQCCNPLQLQH